MHYHRAHGRFVGVQVEVESKFSLCGNQHDTNMETVQRDGESVHDVSHKEQCTLEVLFAHVVGPIDNKTKINSRFLSEKKVKISKEFSLQGCVTKQRLVSKICLPVTFPPGPPGIPGIPGTPGNTPMFCPITIKMLQIDIH